MTAFAKIWYCAVNAGATATDVVRANASMRAHRPVLLTTAFTAMPSKQAKLHNITGPQDMPACTVALVSSILKK